MPKTDERPKRPDSASTRGSAASGPAPPPAQPVLDRSDESFLESILSEDGQAPPLPDRVDLSDLELSASEVASLDARKEKDKKKEKSKGKDKEKSSKDGKPSRFASVFRKKDKDRQHGETLKPEDAISPEEEEQKEKTDLNRVLDRLNLTAKNNKVVNLSGDSAELLAKFTQIFKDLANGVPTAYDDLVGLITDKDGAITRGFEKLPASLQKLVTQLPDKLTGSIAPEILAAAAKSQGIHVNTEDGIKGAAKNMFVPQNLMELVTKPGALVGMLRAIVAAPKTRWPAFIGVNVLWYCYKRGREERLKLENGEGVPVEAGDRVEELPDDLTLPAPHPETTRIVDERDLRDGMSPDEVPPPPAGGVARPSRP